MNSFVTTPVTKGWHKINIYFTVSKVERVAGLTVATCIDREGKEFYLEVTPEFQEEVSSSAPYKEVHEVPLEYLIMIINRGDVCCIEVREEDKLKLYHCIFLASSNLGYFQVEVLPHKKSILDSYIELDTRCINSVIVNNIRFKIKNKNKQEEKNVQASSN